MFYKYDENTDEWHSANEMHFPDGHIVNSKNKEETHDGWEWSDEIPQAYIDHQKALLDKI